MSSITNTPSTGHPTYHASVTGPEKQKIPVRKRLSNTLSRVTSRRGKVGKAGVGQPFSSDITATTTVTTTTGEDPSLFEDPRPAPEPPSDITSGEESARVGASMAAATSAPASAEVRRADRVAHRIEFSNPNDAYTLRLAMQAAREAEVAVAQARDAAEVAVTAATSASDSARVCRQELARLTYPLQGQAPGWI